MSQLTGDRSWVTEALPALWELHAEADVEIDPDRFVEYRDWTGRDYHVCHGIKLVTQITPDGKVWVCPKRKRGLTYTTAPGDWDPSVTGFLSYGFNSCGVFGAVNPTDGNMINAKPFKSSNSARPSEMVAVSDTSGSNDPNNTPAAAWLDSFWAGSSGPTNCGPCWPRVPG